MIVEDKKFEGLDFEVLSKGNYEECQFQNCNFTQVPLAFFKFENCSFKDCNLSNVSINQTSFQDCEFIDCKLTGLNFEHVNPFLFGINCESCDLSFAYFAENDLTRCSFTKCQLTEAQFIEVIANGVDFQYSSFYLAVFERCDFSGANLNETKDLWMDISTNKVKGMKINIHNIHGLLKAFELEILY